MTFAPPSNDASTATHDAVSPETGRGFNRYWTARAVRLLRRVAKNPFITQARGDYGRLDENGHGAVCANQLLIELLDNIRNADGQHGAEKIHLIDRILPVTGNDIIEWNDENEESFVEIAERIEDAAGGPEALEA